MDRGLFDMYKCMNASSEYGKWRKQAYRNKGQHQKPKKAGLFAFLLLSFLYVVWSVPPTFKDCFR